MLFPSTTAETFIPGMKGHVGSTLNVPVVVINVMRMKNPVVKAKSTTSRSLTCDFHWMAYRLECEKTAEDSEAVIHPELGRGHSNLCEAHFTVLPQFRGKDQSLQRYIFHNYSLKCFLLTPGHCNEYHTHFLSR